MFEFLDRLISIVLPRIRDFRAFPKRHSMAVVITPLGLTEQIVFPEISIETVEFVQGMDITMIISGNSNEQSCELLKLLVCLLGQNKEYEWQKKMFDRKIKKRAKV